MIIHLLNYGPVSKMSCYQLTLDTQICEEYEPELGSQGTHPTNYHTGYVHWYIDILQGLVKLMMV